MKFNIFVFERKRPKWVSGAFESYKKRFDRSIKIKLINVEPVKNTKTLDRQTIKKKEGERIIRSLGKNDFIVSLDVKGRSWTTTKFKQRFDKWLLSSKDVTFLVGGVNGLDGECLYKSDEIWSLSSLTFLHSIVPVLIIEQLYRVYSIRNSHPYHR